MKILHFLWRRRHDAAHPEITPRREYNRVDVALRIACGWQTEPKHRLAALRSLVLSEHKTYGPNDPGTVRTWCLCCWGDWLPGEPERHLNMGEGATNLVTPMDGLPCPARLENYNV